MQANKQFESCNKNPVFSEVFSKIKLSRTCLLETEVKDNMSWYLKPNTTSTAAPHVYYLWQIITCKLVSIIQSFLVSQHGIFCNSTQCQIIPVITCCNSRKADTIEHIAQHCPELQFSLDV